MICIDTISLIIENSAVLAAKGDVSSVLLVGGLLGMIVISEVIFFIFKYTGFSVDQILVY